MNQLQSSIPYAKITLISFLAIVACADSIEDRITTARTKGETSALARIANDVDALNATEPADYFRYHEQLEAVLETLGATNAVALAELEKQIQSHLRKQCQHTNPEIIGLCLDSKSASARRLTRVAGSKMSAEFLDSVAVFLCEIRTMIVPEYKPLPVSDNVLPPLRTGGPMLAGMDPKAIADPKARAAYENALTENRACHFQNRLQFKVLPRLNREVTDIFSNLCKTVSKKIKFSRDEVDRLANAARLSQEERRSMFRTH